jgi:hypothetical protein
MLHLATPQVGYMSDRAPEGRNVCARALAMAIPSMRPTAADTQYGRHPVRWARALAKAIPSTRLTAADTQYGRHPVHKPERKRWRYTELFGAG